MADLTVDNAMQMYEDRFDDGLPYWLFSPFDEQRIVTEVLRALKNGKPLPDHDTPTPQEATL
jgi:hypothetical protein